MYIQKTSWDYGSANEHASSLLKSDKLKRILSFYWIDRIIAEGGQKTVFLANKAEEKSVALKIGRYRSGSALERLEREVSLLTALDVEGIGKILEFYTDSDCREFIIIEPFYAARPLHECSLLFRESVNVIQLLKRCYEALLPLWEKRVVHRDLKPANLMIKPSREPIIIDFGIARFLDHSSLTDSNAGQGPCTPIYAAREQLTNRKVDIDARTDFFSLAVIASELVSDRHPFSPEVLKNNNDIVENIIEGTYMLEDPRQVIAPGLREFLERSLHPEPYGRFRTPHLALEHLLSL